MSVTFKMYFEKTNLQANELAPGDKIANCNKDCNHYKSEGIVTRVKEIKGRNKNVVGNKVEYKCCNNGKTWKKGDKLEKTEIQLRKK